MLVTIVNACLPDGRGGSPTAVLEEAALSELERRRLPRLLGVSHVALSGDLDESYPAGLTQRDDCLPPTRCVSPSANRRTSWAARWSSKGRASYTP